MQLPIAVTMGDAAGIGPEICARFFAECAPEATFVAGDAGQMRRAVNDFGLALRVEEIAGPEACVNAPGLLPVLNVSHLPADIAYGRVDSRAGHAAHAAIIAATDLALAGRIAALVTAPIHKEALHAAGIRHPGHTEILAERTGTRQFGMMLADSHLRVVLVSIHVSLREALERVTFDNVLATIRLAEQGARAFGIARPRVAVAGLNPHAGEGGLFGREEIEVIGPAVAAARAEGVDASGPHAPDTVFMRARQGAFDVVVAQYHDQGLIPVKYLGIEGGVNITVGLPIIRTSVDHGTAFDIAGRGVADWKSLALAHTIARRMAGGGSGSAAGARK